MTTTTEGMTEQDRASYVAALEDTLKHLDVQSVQIANALRLMRTLRRAAEALDEIKTGRLVIRDYSVEESYETTYTDLGLPESVQAVLTGAFKEPVRDLIAATDAAEAALVRTGSKAEEDRAGFERELRDLTNG